MSPGRQTGKTTSARWLVKHLNASGAYRAIWVDVQNAREQPDPVKAYAAVVYDLDGAVERDLPNLGLPSDELRSIEPTSTLVHRYLARPLDSLVAPARGRLRRGGWAGGRGDVSFLAPLRQGYIDRSETPFPSSIVIVGQRQVRDYVVLEEDRRALAWLGTTSPFNITTEAMTLGAFTATEVEELCEQHTAATGQVFEPAERRDMGGAAVPARVGARGEDDQDGRVLSRSPCSSISARTRSRRSRICRSTRAWLPRTRCRDQLLRIDRLRGIP